MADENSGRLERLLLHISNVRDNCWLIGRRLISTGQEHLGLSLIANGQVHDHSKFKGIEWKYLNDGAWPRNCEDELEDQMFKAALQQHVTTNKHHPEAWPGGINEMDELHIAEMVADWAARSSEQGTGLLEWVTEKAPERFKFSKHGSVYKAVRRFTDLLLEKKFT